MEVYAPHTVARASDRSGRPGESREQLDTLLLGGMRRFLPIAGSIYIALTLAALLFRSGNESTIPGGLAASAAIACFVLWAAILRSHLRDVHAHAATTCVLLAGLGYELARSYLASQTQLSSGFVVLTIVAGYVLLRRRFVVGFLSAAVVSSATAASAGGHTDNPTEFVLTLIGTVFIATAVHRIRRRGLDEVLALRHEDAHRQRELEASEERYALAVQGANDGLWDWRLDSGEIYFSPRWKHVLGFDACQLADEPASWLERIHPKDRERVERALQDHLHGVSPHFECRHRLKTKSETYRWVLVRGLAVRNARGVATRIAGSLTDIHRLKQVERKLRRAATHDRLTGLPNRKLLRLRLREAASVSSSSSERFGVVFLDIDRFKAANDTHGHLVGDQLLREFATRLRNAVRPSDFVARLGGDEFVVLLRNVNGLADIEGAARRIAGELVAPVALDCGEICLSACAGFVLADDAAILPEEWLRRADTAMYSAKAQGPGNIAAYCAQDDSTAGVQALARAVEAKSSKVSISVA